MSKQISLENATVNILLGINGEIHLVAMDKEQKEAVELFVKLSTESVVNTGVKEEDFAEFVGFKKLQNRLNELKKKQRSE